MNNKKRDKVLQYLQNHMLMQALNDVSNMPDEIRIPLFTKFPNYPSFPVFAQNMLNTQFNSFDEFTQTVFNYLKAIPDIYPEELIKQNPHSNSSAITSCIKEVLIGLERYVKMLSLDKNVLKSRFFRHITNEITNHLTDRPDRFESEMLYDYEINSFGSHSIPSKVNPA